MGIDVHDRGGRHGPRIDDVPRVWWSLDTVVIDLGVSPPCERFLTADQLDEMEPFYPLRVMVCERCWLAQVGEYVAPEEIFSDYAYFSSFSTSWLEHARRYALDDAGQARTRTVQPRDGGRQQRRLPAAPLPRPRDPGARDRAGGQRRRSGDRPGIDTQVRFFGRALAHELVAAGRQPDLIAGNNVLAQVPDLDDFLGGLAIVLPAAVCSRSRSRTSCACSTAGSSTRSTTSTSPISPSERRGGCSRRTVSKSWTWRSCPRTVGRCASSSVRPARSPHRRRWPGSSPTKREARSRDPAPYSRVRRSRRDRQHDLMTFLIDAAVRRQAGGGLRGPGKANTLLNWCGIRRDLVGFTVDRNPYKHGRFTPGTRIPIRPPEALADARPDFVWILPWNLADEIRTQLAGIDEWGGQFVTAIPTLAVTEAGGGR